jgi:hypothetical protein
VPFQQHAERFGTGDRIRRSQSGKCSEHQLGLADVQPTLADEPRAETGARCSKLIRLVRGEHQQDPNCVLQPQRLGELVRGCQHDRRSADRDRALESRQR